MFSHFETYYLVAIPTAIAAFYLPVTLMCLLYFRIYRETVKRRKELHLLQAQHQCSSSATMISASNSNTNCRSNNKSSNAGTISNVEHDESISTDSTRSYGKILSFCRSDRSRSQQQRLFHVDLGLCCVKR